jgi:hypothetical protein
MNMTRVLYLRSNFVVLLKSDLDVQQTHLRFPDSEVNPTPISLTWIHKKLTSYLRSHLRQDVIFLENLCGLLAAQRQQKGKRL